ncbi:MAG TPA: UDP-N-acetylglucosamine 1-carboxyvinyltransferase, partial [Acidimicrobiales bacterium]
MERIVVEPNGPLSGTVRSGGAKNSALKLMVACLLAEGRTVLSNVPRIADVETMAEVLRAVGARVERLEDGDLAVTTPPAHELVPVAPYELVERMRASVVVLGLLLARCGSVRMPLPGGDDFGDRPIDFHVNGLGAMGARFESSHGEVRGTVPAGRLVGTRVVLEYPSHTATDNLLMAAVLAKGTTVIENAAKEPEVMDLAAMLTDMGAVVRGAGTSRIEIEGVDELRPVRHAVVPDRVVAATFLAAVGLAGGEVTIADARPEHMEMLLHKVGQMGVATEMGPGGLRAAGNGRLQSSDIATLPYPGVATDYSPLLVA